MIPIKYKTLMKSKTHKNQPQVSTPSNSSNGQNRGSNSSHSYHGNYAKVESETTINEYGVLVERAVCYFNRLFDKKNLNNYGYSARDFAYLFRDLAQNPDALLPHEDATITKLKQLADFMVDRPLDEQVGNSNSIIPPGYTYWGQFLDHDISAGTDRSHGFTLAQERFDPVAPDQVVQDIENMRSAFFDLDSIYGDKEGPFCSMHQLYDPVDIVKFKIGKNDENINIPGEVPNPALGKMRDLPRNNDGLRPDDFPTVAIIGDDRNDENTIIGQFHLAMLKFHNKVVDAIREEEPDLTARELFFKARNEVKNHYQWLIINDFLKRMLNEQVYDWILDELKDPNSATIFDDFGNGQPFMPLEFSTAAYRFGHSMVRNNYDFNLNFGSGRLTDSNDNGVVLDEANFSLLFAFTGKGGQRLANANPPQPTIRTTLPFNWIIEWERFFDTDQSRFSPDQFARKIDTLLAVPLSNLENDVFDLRSMKEQEDINAAGIGAIQFNKVMKHLAMRNLLRGYLLSIPTSQAIVKELQDVCGLAIDHLTEAELLQNIGADFADFMRESGFLERTPLWFYILKEAEVKENGNRLGKLGSYIVGRTFAGLLKKETRDNYYEKYIDVQKYDPDTCAYLHNHWTPQQGIVYKKTGAFAGIMDLLRFAEVALPKTQFNNIIAQNTNSQY